MRVSRRELWTRKIYKRDFCMREAKTKLTVEGPVFGEKISPYSRSECNTCSAECRNHFYKTKLLFFLYMYN